MLPRQQSKQKGSDTTKKTAASPPMHPQKRLICTYYSNLPWISQQRYSDKFQNESNFDQEVKP